MKLKSRRKLKPNDASRFAHAEPALFRELAAVVCATGMLPQKELHECWQMAYAVHKAFPEITHIADMAAGHGLLAWILVLLARSEENPIPRTAVAVDVNRPRSAQLLAASMIERWPQLVDSVHYVEGSIDAVIAEEGPGTLLVAAHACGSLSDGVLLAAISSRSPFAIMPCCHSLRKQATTLGTLALASGRMPFSMEELASVAAAKGQPAAIDQFRIEALTALGYQIQESFIDKEITPYHHIIMGQVPHALPASLPAHQVRGADGKVKRQGEIRVFETIPLLNVSNNKDIRTLSMRPSREWIRSFDLSYWVDDDTTGQQIAVTLERLVHDLTLSCSGAGTLLTTVTICDRYTQPVSQRRAFTYRVEVKSSAVAITRDDALQLRKKLCSALDLLAGHQSNFSWRG
jgi:hypothetical protein